MISVGLQSGLSEGVWLDRERLNVYPIILIVFSIIPLIGVLAFNGWLLPNGSPFGADFISFWTAARNALDGNPLVAYTPEAFKQLQMETFATDELYAFFYPPHYLVYLLPLGGLSFYGALFVWLVLTFATAAAVLVAITGKTKETLILAIAFPATLLNLAHGQNAFLSAALLGAGLLFLDKRPLLAGFFFGLLTFKPQLGLIIPLVLLAGGYWRTIFSAGFTLFALIGISALFFGAEVWSAFWVQRSFAFETLQLGLVDPAKMISIYSMLRSFGLGYQPAFMIHMGFAIAVAALVFWAWLPRKKVSFEMRASLVCMAALIVTPFALNYDLFILGLAIAWMAQTGMKNGFLAYEKTVLAAVFVSPFVVLGFMGMGISVAAFFVFLLFFMVLRRSISEINTQ